MILNLFKKKNEEDIQLNLTSSNFKLTAELINRREEEKIMKKKNLRKIKTIQYKN